uniref:Lipoprotein-attachment site-containing protein n=1 Tax=Candidatus Kentrum eta TaxID=2126337 RepID=A0A450UHM8_9GAMM|nr:MAG: hypothetical protein BECKH772A_GA0070896_100382 [Candidatus Kentron sp. H]VFJ93065.1 MAG: hypothetical protein BECKH772B_GA0070898_100382 [Candidatus Kentron sp. H]VFJ99910.1 MAG: hypothetical protein BECKH772C_GA0070978_100372 [Candidatus Kentron sp. H]
MKAVREDAHRLPCLTAIFLVTGFQVGCGQSGPLYFPDEATEKVPTEKMQKDEAACKTSSCAP